MSLQPPLLPFLTLSGGVIPLFVPDLYPWRGRKGSREGTLYETPSSSGADVASSTRRKSRKLLIPKHQLLLFSFQTSFTSRFRDTSPAPAEEVWGTLPPLDTPQPEPPLTERLRLIREGRESWRADAGGQRWGQGLRPAGATRS